MRRLTEGLIFIWLGLVASAGLRAEPLSEGAVIPEASLLSHQGKKISLTGYAASRNKKNLLLVFFRTGTCSVCISQLRDIAQNFDRIDRWNAAVLGISLDDAIVHARTAEKIQNRFPLLLDPEGKTVKAFGILNPEDSLSRPSLYLVGPDRKILYKYVGKALSDRPPLSEVLDVVRHYSGGLPTRTSN